MKLANFCLLALVVICHKFNYIYTEQSLVNSKVERVIDISSQLVKIVSKITVENVGKSSVQEYLLTFDENHSSHLAYLSAFVDKKTLQVNKVDDVTWKVELSGSNTIIAGGVTPTIEVSAVFSRILKPYPSEILQSERQLILYEGNHYFRSPYLTKTQTTKVKLASSSIESYTKLKPSSQSDQVINYGPYENVASNSYSKLQVHSENNTPFLTVAQLDRTIELSHWSGVISIEEIIDVVHTGAKLKGPFSRYEFQREPTNGISSVKSWKTKLPATASDIYYRDEIGNISTSNLKFGTSYITAELRPRFPLFGGWKTHYTLGYYIPTVEYLFNEGTSFVLKIPFIDHIYDNQVIESATVKIILPEGAADIKLRQPYSVTRERDQVHYTYLDTIGRTVLVLKKSNLVEDHIQNFEVLYNYHKILMLQEPLLVVSALFLLCIAVIIYVRLDFSIIKKEKTQ